MDKDRIISYLALLACFLTALARPWPVRAGDVEKQIETPIHKAVQIEQKTQADQFRWRDEKEKKTKIFDDLETKIKALEAQKDRQGEQFQTQGTYLTSMETDW